MLLVNFTFVYNNEWNRTDVILGSALLISGTSFIVWFEAESKIHQIFIVSMLVYYCIALGSFATLNVEGMKPYQFYVKFSSYILSNLLLSAGIIWTVGRFRHSQNKIDT